MEMGNGRREGDVGGKGEGGGDGDTFFFYHQNIHSKLIYMNCFQKSSCCCTPPLLSTESDGASRPKKKCRPLLFKTERNVAVAYCVENVFFLLRLICISKTE